MKSIATFVIVVGFFSVCIQNRAYGDSRLSRARLDVKSLQQAVTAYWVKYGEWPSSLEMLTRRLPDGTPAILNNERAIFDPWNQPYHYDPKQLSPDSDRPLIWSDGSPGDSNGKIANWGEGANFKPPNNASWLPLAALLGGFALFMCWVCLPKSENRLTTSLKTLALLAGLILWAACFYFIFNTMMA